MAETMYDRLRERNNPSATVQETEKQSTETQEEKTVEEKVQTEEVEKSVTEEKGQESSQENKTFDVSGFNQYFEKSFADENELRNLFEYPEKIKDYETRIEDRERELQSAHEKYNALLDSIDPEKVFPNKDAVALSQLAEKYPRADVGILSKIRSTEVDSMDKLDALVMIDKLTVPSNVSDSIRKSEILKSLNIEEDGDGLSDNDRYRIEREYVSKSGILQEIKEFQPELKKFDFELERSERQEKKSQELESLKSHNEKALKILLDGYKETKSAYKEDGKDRFYTYIVDNDFKERHFNEMLDNITNSGVKITSENAQDIAKRIDNEYWLQNRDKIIHDAIKQATSEQKEAAHSEIHSDSPTNKSEAPPGKPKVPQTMMEQFRQGLLKR